MMLLQVLFVVWVIVLPQCLHSFHFVPIQQLPITIPTPSSPSFMLMSTVPSPQTKKVPFQRSYWKTRNAVNINLPDKRRLTDKEEIFAGKLSRIAKELEKKKKSLEKDLERDITLKEWAEAANLSIEELKQTIRLSQLAREKLITHNLRLIDYSVCDLLDKRPNSFTSDVRQTSSLYSGLFQQGVIGLKKAAEYYDGRYKFSFFAVHFIRNELHRYLTSESITSHVPHKIMLTGIRINNMRKRLTKELHRPPTDEELSNKLSFSIHRINKVLQFIKLKSNVKSLQSPIKSATGNVGDVTNNEMLTYGDSLVRSTPVNLFISEKIVLDYILASDLSKEEIEVLMSTFGFTEIGNRRNPLTGKLFRGRKLDDYINQAITKLTEMNPLREGDELIEHLSSKIGFVSSMSPSLLA